MKKVQQSVAVLALVAVVGLASCASSGPEPVNTQETSPTSTTSVPELEAANVSVRNPRGQVTFTAKVRLTGLIKPAQFSVDVTSVSDDLGTTSVGVETSIDTLTNGTNTFTVTAPSLSGADAGKNTSSYVVRITDAKTGQVLSDTGKIAVYKKAAFSLKLRRTSNRPDVVKVHGRAKTSQLVGKTLVVSFKPRGSDSFKRIGKAKVKLDGWKWSLKSNHVSSGTVRVTFPGTKYLLKNSKEHPTSF